MIAYFDTSAFVPLLIDEPTTVPFRELWSDASTFVASRLTYVEASSAIARAHRAGRIAGERHVEVLAARDAIWRGIKVLEVDDRLMRRASELAAQFGLRGYDAVHCAAAESINDDDLVAASSDAQLLAVWHTLGLTTFSGAAPTRG
jgi:predicted nucleic acid-binding protein